MTIPGYSYIPKTLRRHIHMGLVPDDGSDPDGFGTYNEPPYTFESIKVRQPVYNVTSDLARSWTGVPYVHTLKSGDDQLAVVFTNYRYDLRVNQEELDILAHLVGNKIYLVDNFHCADNLDHTIYTKVYWFDKLDYSEHRDPMLTINYVSILVQDLSTIAPG